MAILNRGMAGAPQGLQMAYMRDPRLRLAQQLQMSGSDTSPVQHWTQGLARLAQALAGNRMEDRADSEYRGQAEAYQNDMRGLMAPVMEQGTAGPGPRQGPGGPTMRPANYAEMSERAGRFSSPYAMEAAQPMLQAAMQAQAAEQAKLRDPMYGRANVRGVGLVDMRGGSPNVLMPEQKAPDELERLFAAANIPPGDPRRAAYAEQMLARRGQPAQTNVNVTGDTGPRVGTIPPGYQLAQRNGAYVMEPIPGGPAAREIEKGAAALDEGKRQQATSADVVTQDIQRALGLMDSAVLPTTGMFGQQVSKIGGTNAGDISSLLDTIKANTAFDKLAEMRRASPTGAALGSVTERELALLAAVRGNVEQSQSAEQFRRNLTRMNNTMLDIVHGPGQGPERIAEAKPGNQAGPRAGTGAQKPTASGPAVGTIEDGYRYKGGPANDPNNWERVVR